MWEGHEDSFFLGALGRQKSTYINMLITFFVCLFVCFRDSTKKNQVSSLDAMLKSTITIF